MVTHQLQRMRIQKLEWETGCKAPSTNPVVEFELLLAIPVAIPAEAGRG